MKSYETNITFFLFFTFAVFLTGCETSDSSSSDVTTNTATTTTTTTAESTNFATLSLPDGVSINAQSLKFSRVKGGLSLTSGYDIDSSGKMTCKSGMFTSTGSWDMAFILEQDGKKYIWYGSKDVSDTDKVELGSVSLNKIGTFQSNTITASDSISSASLSYSVSGYNSAVYLLGKSSSLTYGLIVGINSSIVTLELPAGSQTITFTLTGKDSGGNALVLTCTTTVIITGHSTLSGVDLHFTK